LNSRIRQSHSRTTRSAAETRALGRLLAAPLHAGDVLCLRGELGAGKTTFIQGLAEGLGVTDPATSPSFTIIHEHRGRLHFYHLDLYRLAPGDLADIGIEEVLAAEAVVAIEWAERLPAHLSGDGLDIDIDFEQNDENVRRFHFRSRGERGTRILKTLTVEPDACPRA
jgi:tRNA threonylcarbamoyladenosine biosynthesis protein TsaE